jgi:hypothetical protein
MLSAFFSKEINMKKRMIFGVVFMLVAMSMAVPYQTSSAQVIRTPYEATATNLCPGDPGCTSGQWSFPGGNIHVRNMVTVYESDSADGRVSGINTTVMSANWDASFVGVGWGTYRLESDVFDGYWEGTYTVQMDEWGYICKIRGKGYGAFEGLLLKAIEINGSVVGVITELP